MSSNFSGKRPDPILVRGWIDYRKTKGLVSTKRRSTKAFPFLFEREPSRPIRRITWTVTTNHHFTPADLMPVYKEMLRAEMSVTESTCKCAVVATKFSTDFALEDGLTHNQINATSTTFAEDDAGDFAIHRIYPNLYSS